MQDTHDVISCAGGDILVNTGKHDYFLRERRQLDVPGRVNGSLGSRHPLCRRREAMLFLRGAEGTTVRPSKKSRRDAWT